MVGMRSDKRRKDAIRTRTIMRIELTDMLREHWERSWKYPCPCGRGSFVVRDQDVGFLREKDNLVFCHGCRRAVCLDVPVEY